MLDYKLLEAMARVITEGGFDRAAQVLHLSQSAVSQRVKLLEEQTGQILLVRTSPPRATAAGKRLLKHFQQVQRLEGDLLEALPDPFETRWQPLAIGVNADSLATWLPGVIIPFVSSHHLVIDMRADDQDQTHRMLKNGEVIGCISTESKPIQGCRNTYLGKMVYRLVATPEFTARWFADGLTAEAVGQAPILVFNRKDRLHQQLLDQALIPVPADRPVHYLPSSEKFADFIASGLACGMLPDQQSRHLLDSGVLVDLAAPHQMAVHLYWHCWNLNSDLLSELSRHLLAGARQHLGQ